MSELYNPLTIKQYAERNREEAIHIECRECYGGNYHAMLADLREKSRKIWNNTAQKQANFAESMVILLEIIGNQETTKTD